MARAGFYNDNEYRDYPFLTRIYPLANNWAEDAPGPLTPLPHELVVDFGVIVSCLVGYDDTEHTICLVSLTRLAGGVQLEFQVRDTEGDAVPRTSPLCFTIPADAAEFTTMWAETAAHSVTGDVACTGEPLMEGYLVVGKLDAILAATNPGDVLEFAPGLWVIEPSRIQNLNRGYLRTISLANYPRTVIPPPLAEGSSVSESEAEVQPQLMATCLRGNIYFKEGFNCTIRQEDPSNTIIIGAAVGAGAGVACNEVPRFPGEQPPPGSPFLTGGPACNEIIKTVNGVSGRRIRLDPGPGFRVTADPDRPHTLIVTMDMGDFAACNPQDVGPLPEVSLGSED